MATITTSGTQEQIHAIRAAVLSTGADAVCSRPNGATEWHMRIDALDESVGEINKILEAAKLEAVAPVAAAPVSDERIEKLEAELRQATARADALEADAAKSEAKPEAEAPKPRAKAKSRR